MGNLYMQELLQSTSENANPTKMEEVAIGVVHSFTKETTTKYKHLSLTPIFEMIG